MHKVTDPCSVKTPFSIPPAEAGKWLPRPIDENDQRQSESAQLDPLYLFGCSVLWHSRGDAAGAWELIHGLHSANQGTRAVASALLIKRRTPRERGAAQARRIASSTRCGS